MTVIRDIVLDNARRFGDKPALQIERGTDYYTISYNKVFEHSCNIASFLHQRGFVKGDKIALIGANSPEWAIVFFAIQIGGFTGIPIDRLLGEEEIRHILNDSEARFLFADDKFIEILGVVASPFCEGIVSLSHENSNNIYSVMDTPDYSDFSSFPVISPDDDAVYLYTSGTTGKTKGVMLTQQNIVANCEGTSRALPLTEYDGVVSILPLHHAYEMTAGFLYVYSRGALITYSLSLVARDILKAVKYSKATLMVGVPLVFEKMHGTIVKNLQDQPFIRRTVINILFLIARFVRLYDKRMNATKNIFKPLLKKAGLFSIRHFIAGAAPLPPHVNRFFYLMGIPILQGYGLSETSPVISVVLGDDIDFYSVGPAFYNLKVRINKPDETGVGEIVVRGPSVMKGYYKEPEKTAEVLKRGWLYTGDYGFVDEKGRIHIKGRLKNVIVSTGGKNIYPEEIEDVLIQCSYIEEIVVFGKDEPEAMVYPNMESIEHWAQQHKVHELNDDVVLKLIKTEVDKLNEKLAPYKRVRKITIRKDEFPKTSTRKIKRFLVGQE